jgi:hypothetical protein
LTDRHLAEAERRVVHASNIVRRQRQIIHEQRLAGQDGYWPLTDMNFCGNPLSRSVFRAKRTRVAREWRVLRRSNHRPGVHDFVELFYESPCVGNNRVRLANLNSSHLKVDLQNGKVLDAG